MALTVHRAALSPVELIRRTDDGGDAVLCAVGLIELDPVRQGSTVSYRRADDTQAPTRPKNREAAAREATRLNRARDRRVPAR